MTIIGGRDVMADVCYKCRRGRSVPAYVKNKACRLCDGCNAVQHFTLKCPHEACLNEPPMSTEHLFLPPEELLGRHYFCSEEHANDRFEVVSIRIYKDSEMEPAIVTTNPYRINMHLTVDMFKKYVLSQIGAFHSIDPDHFLLCVDSIRSPGNQIDYASADDLLYNVARNAPAILFIPRTEYDAQMKTYGVQRLFGDNREKEVNDTFWPTKGTHSQVVHWLKSRGLVGSSLTEAGTNGPRTTKNAPFVVVTFVKEHEMRKLLQQGLSTCLVCPFVLRKVNYVIILHCDNYRPHQEAVYDMLCETWRNSDSYVERIMITFRQFGIGPYGGISIDVDIPMQIIREEQEKEDEEEDVEEEEEEEEKPKRRRTHTTAATIKDLRALGFKAEYQKSIIRIVKESKPNVKPFTIGGPNARGTYFVVVPLTIDQSHVFLSSMIIAGLDEHLMTQPCFLDYRLVLVSCGNSLQEQNRMCAHLLAAARSKNYLQILLESMQPQLPPPPPLLPPPLHLQDEHSFHNDSDAIMSLF